MGEPLSAGRDDGYPPGRRFISFLLPPFVLFRSVLLPVYFRIRFCATEQWRGLQLILIARMAMGPQRYKSRLGIRERTLSYNQPRNVYLQIEARIGIGRYGGRIFRNPGKS